MVAIENTLVSDEVFTEKFICDLNKCKGACCWEGDYGAPLEENELNILRDIYPKIKDYLPKSSQEKIEKEGTHIFFEPAQELATPTFADSGACVYLTYEPSGIAVCGIQKAFRDGIIDFEKPISCHLYPIRIKKYKDYDAINYDRWDICKSACALGKREKMPVFKFLKNAIIRKYGNEYYKQMEAIYKEIFSYK